jgi:hypothetical protein
MMIVLLSRFDDNGHRTLGNLYVGRRTFATIERPWVRAAKGRGGKKGVSCVPAGTYQLVPHNSESFGRVWALVNPDLDVYHQEVDVPAAKRGIARTAVLIHTANWVEELRGCIAPGVKHAKGDRGDMVVSSRAAMAAIRELMTWPGKHSLEITNA